MAVKTVAITGTSSGIGRATAQHFLARGWWVVALQRDPQAGSSPAGPNRRRDRRNRRAFETARNRFGTIDVLVNNAGFGITGPFEGTSPADFERQFRTNVFGVANAIRQVLPIMRSQRRGVLINVSSIGGRIGVAFIAGYNATKFAVEGLSESLRYELAGHGIAIKVIEPGGTQSDFMGRSQGWADHPAYELPFAAFKRSAERMNSDLGTAEEVAAAVFRAATDTSPRLRYPVNAGPMLLLQRLLPDVFLRRMLSGLTRAT